jgi:hypothetical protein
MWEAIDWHHLRPFQISYGLLSLCTKPRSSIVSIYSLLFSKPSNKHLVDLHFYPLDVVTGLPEISQSATSRSVVFDHALEAHHLPLIREHAQEAQGLPAFAASASSPTRVVIGPELE